MEQIAPSGPVYQAGTLSGSPPAMAAGIAALDVLRENPGLYVRLERLGERLETGLRDCRRGCRRGLHRGSGGQHGHAVSRDRPGPLI